MEAQSSISTVVQHDITEIFICHSQLGGWRPLRLVVAEEVLMSSYI